MTMNPYQPPATGKIQLVGGSAVGGTLQDGIKGNYDFLITDVLKEAWQKTDGVKGTFFAAVFVCIMVLVGIELIFFIVNKGITEFFIGRLHEGMSSSVVQIVMPIIALFQLIVTTIVSLPLFVGIMMIGVYRSVDLPVRFSIVFDYFEYTIPIFIAAILMNIMVGIGSLLLLIPAIYLIFAYGLTYPLIVEKNLGTWEAMETSRKAITHHWFKVFFTYFFMGFIFIIGSIPLIIGSMITDNLIVNIIGIIFLGISLIWTAPMMVNVTGILYRIMFGVEETRSEVVAR